MKLHTIYLVSILRCKCDGWLLLLARSAHCLFLTCLFVHLHYLALIQIICHFDRFKQQFHGFHKPVICLNVYNYCLLCIRTLRIYIYRQIVISYVYYENIKVTGFSLNTVCQNNKNCSFYLNFLCFIIDSEKFNDFFPI